MKQFFILFLCFPLALAAQEDISIGGSVGLSSYQGDLVPTFIPKVGDANFSAGVFLRLHHNDRITTRVNIQYGFLEGSDANGGPTRVARNLSFWTNLWEVAILEEFNILSYHAGTRHSFSPYVFGGVAAFYFNPKTEYYGQVVELQPVGTEGQGIPGLSGKYSLFQVAIPIGAGLKLGIAKDATLSVEIGGRKLFTDYLDDVSGPYIDSRVLLEGNGPLAAALGNRIGEYYNSDPVNTPGGRRGNPKYLDWYVFSNISLAFSLDGDGSLFGRNMKIIPCFNF